MKRIIVAILFLNLCAKLVAQKTQVISVAQLKDSNTTAQQFLGLSSKYVVINCHIHYVGKEMDAAGLHATTLSAVQFNVKNDIQPCPSPPTFACLEFKEIWKRIVNLLSQGHKVSIRYTTMKKSKNMEIKYGEKMFIAK